MKTITISDEAFNIVHYALTNEMWDSMFDGIFKTREEARKNILAHYELFKAFKIYYSETTVNIIELDYAIKHYAVREFAMPDDKVVEKITIK